MLQECSIINVCKVFFEEPTKSHYLIEISRKLKLAHTSVKKHLGNLKSRGIIIENIEKKGKRKFPIYKANLENKEYKKYKKLYNIYALEDSGIINYLNDKLMPRSIILFGSYSRGEDIENSDIDLYLECKKQDVNLIKFEKILKRKIQLQFKENFNDYPKELKNNIANGIILKGYLEVFR